VNRPLRVGLIGLGRMGRHHARVLRGLDDVDLVAALDPAGDRYRAVDGIPLVTDLDDLLAYRLDYAVLACPTTQHEPLGVALAAAGVPTLIEKPLAADIHAAYRLTAAFSAAAVPAAIGYTDRFNPALTALHARLEAGQLGDIIHIATHRTGPYPARISDVGVVHDLATHDIDLTAWITGQNYTSITARTAHRSRHPHEDLLAALAQLADGTIAHHHVTWLSPLKQRTTVVTGDRGCLTADTLTTRLTHCANRSGTAQPDGPGAFPGVTEGDVTRYTFTKTDPLLAEHQAFRDAVRGHRPVAAPIQHGLHAVLVATAAVQAAHTATTTPIPRRVDPAELDRPPGGGSAGGGDLPVVAVGGER
jgi:predicted dehydrogenase